MRNGILLYLLILLTTPFALADSVSRTSYLDVSHTLLDPDWGWGPFENENGYTVNAEAFISPNYSVNAWYIDGSDASVNGGENHRPPFLWYSLSSWYGVAGKWHQPLNDRSSWFVALSWDHMASDSLRSEANKSFSGAGYHAGIQYYVGRSLSLLAQVGRVNLIVDDTQIIAELSYKLSEHLAVNARVRDLDQMDLTAYDLGLRWHF